jgi:2-hydroxymuconate-semialdehyde hydrolase
MAGYVTTSVRVGEHRMRVHRSGESNERTLVFLHGSGPRVTALSNWEGALERLGDRFDCVAPDILGFGNSSHPDPPPPSSAQFTRLRVETLLGLLDALDLREVDLVGNSMGGLLALEMALAQPARVARMTLMGSGGIPFSPGPDLASLVNFYENPTAEALEQLMTCFLFRPDAFGDLAELSRRRLELVLKPEVRRSHLATFAGGTHSVDLAKVPSIMSPVLLIHGREDRIIPVDVSMKLHSLLPHSQLHILGECGHWSQLEKPDEFDYLLAGFHGRDGL